jgi:hypothetical protein
MAADNKISGLPGILRLTPEVRREIYLYAGVECNTGYGYYFMRVPGVYNLGESVVEAQREIGSGFKTFYGLLLSCRTIYTEASALLYSENRFVVRYHSRWYLAPLRALTPHALAHLGNLNIILTQTSCHEQVTGDRGIGICCGDGASCYYAHDHNLPPGKSDAQSKAILAEWNTTVAYLAAHITPGQLELNLVCDVHHTNLKTAKLVLESLRLLPRLKDCHVRLCGTREPELQQLAQDAVLRARGILASDHPVASSASTKPRLISLPREVLLRILEYTDLVTPHKEVMWRQTSRGYYIESAPCYKMMGEVCPPQFHHGCQFVQCWDTEWPYPSNGCFCRQRHSAASSRCRCWAPPTPLFLVCRALYSEANRVFYSKNRFIVIETPFSNPYTPWPQGDYPYNQFAASQFLRRVVPRHCLQYIRFLELVFAPFNHLSKPREGHPALENWYETFTWVKTQLNLPGLILRVVMADSGDEGPEGSWDMTEAQGIDVLTVYQSIILPVQLLDPEASDVGLARFYAELAWPFQWTGAARRKRKQKGGKEWLKSKDRELKVWAEEYIMGERYERVHAAANEPQASLWTWACLPHACY